MNNNLILIEDISYYFDIPYNFYKNDNNDYFFQYNNILIPISFNDLYNIAETQNLNIILNIINSYFKN